MAGHYNVVKRHDFLKVVKKHIAVQCVRKVSNGSRPGPGDDGGEKYPNEDRPPNTVEHEKCRKYSL